jgi:hypothetical protein
MAICPVCLREHSKVVCPYCTSQRSRDAYLEFQKQWVPGFIEGRFRLTLARSRERPWHLLLVGDPEHAYCGEKVSPNWERRRVDYDGTLLYAKDPMGKPTVCPLCAEEFERLRSELAGPVRTA